MDESRVLAHDWYPRPLPPNVLLGERSWLYSSYAFLHYRSQRPCGVRIGHDTGIYNGTFFELGTDGEVEVGNFCTLVGPIISTNGRVTVGDYSFIAHEVFISDMAVALPPDHPSQPQRRSPPPKHAGSGITLGEDVWIGARAVLLSGTHLGQGVIVGAGAVVDFAAPPYAIIAGNPGRIVGWASPKAGRGPDQG